MRQRTGSNVISGAPTVNDLINLMKSDFPTNDVIVNELRLTQKKCFDNFRTTHNRKVLKAASKIQEAINMMEGKYE